MSKAQIANHVTHERWQQAQQWEESHWIKSQQVRAKYGKNYIWRILSAVGLAGKYRGDDWNLWWKEQFADYDFLPANVDNAIEVGCGPYTNIRHIIPTCVPNHLFLSDPLIKTYVKFKLAFAADAYRNAFCILDDHPLEECPYRGELFELVVMINVLDHVQDAAKCMDNLIKITKPGGWLIVGQDLTDETDLAALSLDPGLIGHPIKLTGDWLKSYLDTSFQPKINKILQRNEGRDPSNHCGTLLFAGTKLSS